MHRIAVAAKGALTCIVAQFTWAQPAPAPQASSWNLLVEGGKGNFVTAPNCHPLEYFAGSPLLFDYEQDFFQSSQSDLRLTTTTSNLGLVEGRRVFQIVQQVQDAHWGDDMVVKRLMVERERDRFCAIYQQVYAAVQVTVTPASIFTIDGKPVLKTLDRNGNATWNEEYWTFNKDGPIHVNLLNLGNRISETIPKGDRLANGPFDLRRHCQRVAVWKPEGNCAACGSNDGYVLASLAINPQLTAAWAHWFPASVSAVCPNE